MARYLVRGGAGLIRTHIVERLVELGESVVVLDYLRTGRIGGLTPSIHSITFVAGDARKLDRVWNSCTGTHYVLHQATLPSVPRSVRDPIGSSEANVNGTLNVLVAARGTGVTLRLCRSRRG